MQIAQLVLRQAFGNEQDAVGAGGAGFDDLVAVDDEVLPQHGDRHGRPHTHEVVEAAAEIPRIGQHADAGRAVPDIGCGDVDGIRAGPDLARRRRPPLHLGDQGRTVAAPRSAATKSRAGGKPRGGGQHVAHRAHALRRSDFARACVRQFPPARRSCGLIGSQLSVLGSRSVLGSFGVAFSNPTDNRMLTTDSLLNQHRIPIAVEPVLLGDRHVVGVTQEVAAAEGVHQGE